MQNHTDTAVVAVRRLPLWAAVATMAATMVLWALAAPAGAMSLWDKSRCLTPITELRLDGEPGNRQVSIRWDRDFERGGRWHYELQTKPKGRSWSAWTDVLDKNGRPVNLIKRHTVTGLTNGVEYSIRVRCSIGSFDGRPSNTITATPVAHPAPVFSDGASASRTLNIPASDGDAVGAPLSASDSEGDTITYRLDYSEGAAEMFRIDSDTGQLRASVPSGNPNIYTDTGLSSFEFTVIASDGRSGGEAKIRVTVNLVSQQTSTQTQGPVTSEATAEPEQPATQRPSLTAMFHAPPASHDGTAFTVEFRLSESPQGLGYRTVRDDVIDADGGTVTRAKRVVRGSNHQWLIHVTPDGNGPVTLSVERTESCSDTGAVCSSDGRRLTNSAAVHVPGPATTATQESAQAPAPEPETKPVPVALTAAWSPPTSHDGTAFTFRLTFSEEVRLSYKNLRDVILHADGGAIIKSRRVVKGSNLAWDVTIVPHGTGDVVVTLAAAQGCTGPTAICTHDGVALAGALRATVTGN